MCDSYNKDENMICPPNLHKKKILLAVPFGYNPVENNHVVKVIFFVKLINTHIISFTTNIMLILSCYY